MLLIDLNQQSLGLERCRQKTDGVRSFKSYRAYDGKKKLYNHLFSSARNIAVRVRRRGERRR